jgi:transcriptional regulator with XRE-family HTH domain
MDIKQKYAKRLRSLRKESGMSQEELAFRAKLDRTYINSVENGKRNISIVNIEKIVKALDISVSEFFDISSFKSN